VFVPLDVWRRLSAQFALGPVVVLVCLDAFLILARVLMLSLIVSFLLVLIFLYRRFAAGKSCFFERICQ
jgi:hypothetical protein